MKACQATEAASTSAWSGKDVEQRVKPVLIKLEEAHQHQRAGQQMGDVEIDPAHQKLPETNRSSVAKKPEHQRHAEEFRHAEHSHLGDRRSRTAASRNPPTASLPT